MTPHDVRVTLCAIIKEVIAVSTVESIRADPASFEEAADHAMAAYLKLAARYEERPAESAESSAMTAPVLAGRGTSPVVGRGQVQAPACPPGLEGPFELMQAPEYDKRFPNRVRIFLRGGDLQPEGAWCSCWDSHFQVMHELLESRVDRFFGNIKQGKKYINFLNPEAAS